MRLIDADALIKQIQKERECGFLLTKNLSIYAMSSVNHTPTAFDVDKVVEELEALKNKAHELMCIYPNKEDAVEYGAYEIAIEIVKRGGLND